MSSSSYSAALGSAPLHYLRPILFHLRRRSTLLRLHSLLIEKLRIRDSESHDHTMNIHLDTWQLEENTVDQVLRHDFRSSLKRHLFGYDELLLLRMRLSLADFAWVSSDCFSYLEFVFNVPFQRNSRRIQDNQTTGLSRMGC